MTRPDPVRPYGEGIYRRRIALRAHPRHVQGELEDDFHRFGVALHHDGAVVRGCSADARRHPWTTCPEAGGRLARLVDLPLAPRPDAAAAGTDPRQQCTHLFDLAALCVAHAASGAATHQYDVAVPDRRDDATRATLARDGAPLLAWDLRGHTIATPGPYAGLSLRGAGFSRFCRESLEPALHVAAFVLRRAVMISLGRMTRLDDVPNAGFYMNLAGGSCYTFQPGRAETAQRTRGSQRDFSAAPDALLADIEGCVAAPA